MVQSEHVEDDKYFLTLIRYIHQNPIKAGICKNVEDKITVRVTDEQAKMIIEKFSNCKSVPEFQGLSTKLKEKHIRKFHQHGISIRQISRLCGVTKGMVEKCLKA